MAWVIVICLSKNAGFYQFCPLIADQVTTDHVTTQQQKNEDETGLTKQCELSEKLIQVSQNHLDSFIVPLFLFTLVLLSINGGERNAFRHHTEPIPEKVRVHLKLCVFRE
ncbi:hypothetical protein ACPV4A_09550 [Vibrio rotiferianus]|uniref:hypothetical protein n=1 Tax=Vibrio rotiferianus TaxID=190895 RepID=UPI00406A2E5D